MAESALCYTREKDVFFIHVKKTCFSLFPSKKDVFFTVSSGFQSPCYAPAVAESGFFGVFGACYT